MCDVQIKTVAGYWKWFEWTFLPALFATKYANGTEIKYWQDRACISDLDTRRVGVARIRQMRVKNGQCLPALSELVSESSHACVCVCVWYFCVYLGKTTATARAALLSPTYVSVVF